MRKKKLLMETVFEYTDDRFIEEFCREAPVGALPLDSHKRLLRGEELKYKTGTSITKIRLYDVRLVKKKLH